MIIIGFIILVLLAFVYVALPLWAKIVVFIINSFIPDPIPVLDEVLMIVAIINNILRLNKALIIWEWMRKHKILSICLILVIIISSFILIAFILNKVISST